MTHPLVRAALDGYEVLLAPEQQPLWKDDDTRVGTFTTYALRLSKGLPSVTQHLSREQLCMEHLLQVIVDTMRQALSQ